MPFKSPIFSSILTLNFTLHWIASWFLQKCENFLNKIHYVFTATKKEAKFTNSDAYGHSNTKLLQKLRLYSTKRIFRYIYYVYVSSIQQCVFVRKSPRMGLNPDVIFLKFCLLAGFNKTGIRMEH